MADEVLSINLQTTTQLPVFTTADEVLTDARLVASVLDGDEAAFGEIFERHKRAVTRTAARFFRETADIEECVQKAFTKTYFSLKSFRGGDDRSFAAWVTRIAINVCYDELRRRQKAGEDLLTDLSGEECEFLDAVADGRQPSAESSLIATQLAEKILSSLDAKDRIAVTLVYSEERSLAEVADAMGISVNNLKSRLFRCRNNLKKRFEHLFR
jgi:RNA polymerase sigma-70 factor (ECF subfamily)